MFSGCYGYLGPSESNPSALGYVSSTLKIGCPVNLRGAAVRLINLIVLREAGMDNWNRGFDAEGQSDLESRGRTLGILLHLLTAQGGEDSTATAGNT